MKKLRDKEYSSNLKIKFLAIKKILTSKKFAYFNFEKTGHDTGTVEAFFSSGFTPRQQNIYMSISQGIYGENITSELEHSIVKEAKQIINNDK